MVVRHLRGKGARSTQTELAIAFLVALAGVDVGNVVPHAPQVKIGRLCLEAQQASIGCLSGVSEAAHRVFIDAQPARKVFPILRITHVSGGANAHWADPAPHLDGCHAG